MDGSMNRFPRKNNSDYFNAFLQLPNSELVWEIGDTISLLQEDYLNTLLQLHHDELVWKINVAQKITPTAKGEI